ncbi:MAG: insulinase family protein [Parvibaculaceae bacterium]|nr:insulinase family protein [Parvibaculaceae bacterium]
MAVEVSKLSNGLTILTDDMPGLESASVGIWVDAGSRHETLEQQGLSHMLEHMAFKGTERRTARELAEEIEAVGGHLNAATMHENTSYYARVLRDDVPLAIDILADILQNPTFAPEEVAREQGVILQEIGQAEDTPDDIVFDRLMQVSFEKHALGRPILGTRESVMGFGATELRGYMDERYHAGSMVLAAAGAVDHAQLVDLAQEKFGHLPAGTINKIESAQFAGGEWRKEKELEQTHLTFAYEGVTYEDADNYTAQVFSSVLGGGMSSRLFQEIREKRGLVYSVFSFNWSFSDTGLFGVYAGTSPGDVKELVPVMADEVTRMAEDVTDEEAQRARTQLKAGLVMGMETSANRIEQMARQYMVHGRVLPVHEIIKKVDEVDAKALRAFGQKLLSSPSLAISAIGPLEGLENTPQLTARFLGGTGTK